ncbi:hypothetical protein H4219_003022 [Mycoemilia scoparia]|uniref:Uncharacterized protein n=1 Tax=Mycoemilia scoparia TaxID=417184 RepID=A0A9W8A2H7_9FUNG|nr:hypothetical protein H4219_003022 [Mycoemilia scoparia]
MSRRLILYIQILLLALVGSAFAKVSVESPAANERDRITQISQIGAQRGVIHPEISKVSNEFRDNVVRELVKRIPSSHSAKDTIVSTAKELDLSEVINDVLVASGGLVGIIQGTVCGLLGQKLHIASSAS